jgi:hypothetical protein
MRNRKMSANNKTGFKGVHRRGNRFRAIVSYEGVTYRLGDFDDPFLAHEAYVKKARELHGEFAHDGL